MLVLGVDCSHSSGSICLQQNTSVLFYKDWQQEKSHAERITDCIHEALSTSKITLDDISCLGVVEGPGSFTGLRIAINTVKSLAFAKNLPIYSFNTLEVLAHSVPESKKNLLVLINAHSNMCYLGEFEFSSSWKIKGSIKALKVEDILTQYTLSDFLCIGDGLSAYSESFKNIKKPQSYSDTTSALLLNDLLTKSIPNKKAIHWKDLQPFYVRLSAPEEKVLDQGQRRK